MGTILPSAFCLLLSALSLFFLVSCTAGPLVSTSSAGDSGIAVANEFAGFYEASGGKRFFGDPITDGFVAGDSDRFTQYFQNMRLEYDAADESVIVFPLGEWALAGVNNPQPANIPVNSLSRSFPESNFTVQDEFLTFYESYNGEQLLEQPISPQLDEGDLRVQYFVNGRLEWRPELELDQRIQVGPLGRDHFQAEGENMYNRFQAARPVPFAGIERVDVYTAVDKAILYNGDEQTLYITVFTPGQRPIDGVMVNVKITAGETMAILVLGPTDGQGRIIAPLNDLAIPPGQSVEVETSVYSSANEIIGQSTLAFKTWW